MAQETVERLLDLLLTDGGFRQRSFPPTRDQLQHFDRLEFERQRLSNLDHEAVELPSRELGARIVRA